MSDLKKRYKETVAKQLTDKFGYKNPMNVPVLKKIVINMGLAEAAKDKNLLQDHLNELALIAGQKPVATRATKSIAGFKLREGSIVGAKVTLRGVRMYEFLERFTNITAPRIRDFRGFETRGCDGRGNYSVGLNEQQPFLELDLDKVRRTQGMQLCFVTSAQKDEECIELLRLLGMPFTDQEVVTPASAQS